MLRVTLEMVPFGQEEARRTIGVMEIANVGPYGTKTSDYNIKVIRESKEIVRADIFNYRRSNGAWFLVRRAINALQKNLKGIQG